jgi:cytochrome c oxidase subunit 4
MADSQAPASGHTPVHMPPPNTSGHHVDSAHVASHVRGYLLVGAILIAFTGITVALSYVNFGSREWNIAVAMIVATFKAGLVAAIFMHLKGERPMIWRFLFFTAIFVTGMFVLTFFHWADPIMGSLWNHH